MPLPYTNYNTFLIPIFNKLLIIMVRSLQQHFLHGASTYTIKPCPALQEIKWTTTKNLKSSNKIITFLSC